MTSVPVHTIDGESLSEIAIHNFEKSQKKIEIRVVPYGRIT